MKLIARRNPSRNYSPISFVITPMTYNINAMSAWLNDIVVHFKNNA